MKYSSFNARSPFEIGDRVRLRENVNGARTVQIEELRTITDIACVYYAKSGKVDFRYEFDGDGRYLPINHVSAGGLT